MAQPTYARISDSLLDIFNATEIGTDTTLRDDSVSISTKTPFTALGWPERHKTDSTANETDYLDEDDDPVEQQQFHRISGILSQLIREASNAINSSPSTLPAKHTVYGENADDTPLAIKESDGKLQPHTDSSAMIMDKILSTCTTNTCLPDESSNDNDTSQQLDYTDNIDNSSPTSKESRRRSRLPRPKKLSVESLAQHYHDHQHQHHLHRNRAFSNASSTISSTTSIPNLDEDSTLFSPVTSSLTTPMSRTISPLFLEKELYSQQPHHHHHHHHHSSNYNNNSNECDMHMGSVDNQHPKGNKAKHRSQPTDDSASSLTDSFERLDYSLAKVDTLSRDLANYRRKRPLLHTSGATTVAAPVPPPTSTFISSDNNITANQHHQQPRKKDHSDGWAVLLMILPLFYIPYLLVLALWEKWNLAASVATTTPWDLLLTTIAALMSDGNATIPRVLISSPTATQIIPLVIGLSVYTLFMVILHLLMASKSSSSSAMLAK